MGNYYLKKVRKSRLKMSPTRLGVLIGCGHDGVLHNEERDGGHQCSLLALYHVFDAEPELMIRMLLFTHVPRREKLSDLDLKRLISLAREKLTTSSGDESEFRRWVTLMKKKFVSNEWAYLARVK